MVRLRSLSGLTLALRVVAERAPLALFSGALLPAEPLQVSAYGENLALRAGSRPASANCFTASGAPLRDSLPHTPDTSDPLELCGDCAADLPLRCAPSPCSPRAPKPRLRLRLRPRGVALDGHADQLHRVVDELADVQADARHLLHVPSGAEVRPPCGDSAVGRIVVPVVVAGTALPESVQVTAVLERVDGAVACA